MEEVNIGHVLNGAQLGIPLLPTWQIKKKIFHIAVTSIENKILNHRITEL